MKICPNLADPEVKARWQALVNDPELGRAEAMREFIQAELQKRPIGTPEEVKSKLKKFFEPVSDQMEALRNREGRAEILAKSNDAVLNDPSSMMGIAVLSNPINGKNISLENTDNARAMEVLRKLSEVFGIKFQFVTPDEAVRITANSKNPYSLSKAPGFFYGDTVYFISGALTAELALHEYSHVFIRAIMNDNPVLFTRLYEQAIEADPSLLDEAIAEYEDLKRAMNEAQTDEEKYKLKEAYRKIVAEEVLVKALTRAAVAIDASVKPQGKLTKIIDNLLYAIKQALRKMFGSKSNVAKLNAKTTIDELAQMLLAGEKFTIDTETVSREDVVAYNQAASKLIRDMESITKKAGNEAIMDVIRSGYDTAAKAMADLRYDKNFRAIAEIFIDEFGTSDIGQIKKDLSKYVKVLEKKAVEFEDEAKEMSNQVKSLATTMMRLELMFNRIKEHLEAIKAEKQDQDSIGTAQAYSEMLDHWSAYIDNVKDMMDANDINPRSPMSQLITSIDSAIRKSDKLINDILYEGMPEVIWEQWKDISERQEEKFKENIKRLEERNASPKLIDNRYVEFYGMTKAEYAQYQRLSNAKLGTLSSDDKKNLALLHAKTLDKAIHLTKDKIAMALKGMGRDANWANSYLEGYMYSTDPVVGGFALYYKNNMAEMEVRAQARLNDLVKVLEPAMIKAGVNNLKIGELGKLIGFVDTIGSYKEGKFISKEVWTLLNPYKNYRYDIDKFDHEIRELQKIYDEDQSKEKKEALALKHAEKNKFMSQWFQQEYVEDYYKTHAVFNKFEGDVIGALADKMRRDILDEIKILTDPLMEGEEILDNAKLIDAEWKKYKLLFSIYNVDGTKKEGDDLLIAQRLQEYREASRKFHEFKPIKGAFETAYNNFKEEVHQRLVKENLTPGTEPYKEAMSKRLEEWKARNMRMNVIKKEFFDERNKIIAEIRALLASLPSTMANELDFGEHYKTILDATSIHRDQDGQPVGSDMSEGRKEKVKDAMEAIEKAKKKWAGFSGLTTEDMEKFINLLERKNNGEELAEEEWNEYLRLIEEKNQKGLTKNQVKEVISKFADLKRLQSKEPTEYFLDAVNNQIEGLDLRMLFNKYKITTITVADIEALYDKEILDDLFSQSKSFEKWFKKNHIVKQKFDTATKTKYDSYERLYIWNVIRPNDPAYYETTYLPGEDTPTRGLPSLSYYRRVVKDVYKTGYDPKTGKVKPIIGEQIDNRGEYLPKNIPNSPYINERYFALKNAPEGSREKALFDVLKILSDFHIKSQEGLNRRQKLYLDFPRFEKSNLEALQTKSVGSAVKERMNPLSLLWKRVKDFRRGAKAEAGNELNWKEEAITVRADAEYDKAENVPISGLYDLDTEETSTDIISSVLRYMWGAEEFKQKIKMNPIAKALVKILGNDDEGYRDLDKYNQKNSAIKSIMAVAMPNKKGKAVRKDAFNNFYQKNFMGQRTTGALSDAAWFINIQKAIFGRSSFAFFAFNIPSALKNAFGAKFQATIEAAAGENITVASLARGQAWSLGYMKKLTFGDIYAKGNKSLGYQIGEIFDFDQGRFQKSFGESITRTVAKDTASMSWMYNVRQWTAHEAAAQTFGGMMYKQKVQQNGKDIDYMDAWELRDGKVQLKAGIDPEWGITYDQDGNMIVGKKFKEFRNRVHQVMNKLNGAYSNYDQPEAQRYVLFRFLSFIRRYFTTMFMQRFGKKRWNPGYGGTDQGMYITFFKELIEAMRYGTVAFTPEGKGARMRTLTEMGLLIVLSALTAFMWGWDDDDEDRYEKLRARSGHLPWPFTEDASFNLGGWISLHTMNLAMQVRAENEQFIPWIGFGLDDLASFTDLKSLAFGPTTDSYITILGDISDIVTGSDTQYYKRRVGPYDWQQEGSRKIWNHFFKMFGVNGAALSPADAITNFDKAKRLSRVK